MPRRPSDQLSEFIAPQLAQVVDHPPGGDAWLHKAAYLDGEIAVLTPEGISDFGALQEALGRHGGSREMAYIAFDLLHLNGRDLRPLPLVERKTILEKVLANLPVRSPVQFSSDVTGRGAKFFALACKRHLEGIVLCVLPDGV
jgi:bifunctional non-homologous end joining protein LigD